MVLIFAASAIPKPDGSPGLGPWDKVAHLLAYGALAILLARAIFGDTVMAWRQIALVSILAALYGLTDEFHQSFVAGREAGVDDLIADAVGGFLAAYGLYRFRSRRRVPPNEGMA
jgi:VanZ family protein